MGGGYEPPVLSYPLYMWEWGLEQGWRPLVMTYHCVLSA